MLSVEQRKYDQLYAYRAGMVNTVWVAGIARLITAKGGFVQQTNNLNQMIPFVVADGDALPNWVKDGVNLKVIARVHSSRVDDEPIVVLTALSFETPSIIDMPPREAWERHVREGVPSDDVKPEAYRPDGAQFSTGGVRVADTGNMAKVAGFVSSFHVERPGARKSDGTVTQGCLIITLRQTRDRDDLIPVRCYGSKAEALARRLEVGMPVKVDGKIRVRLKNTGEPADAQGVMPVNKYPYLHANKLCVANREDIREEPKWAQEMVLEHRSKRAARRDAFDAGGPSAAAPQSSASAMVSVPEQGKATVQVLDADLRLPEETLLVLNAAAK